MLATSSSTLVAMASQLSEAEERERGFTGRGRWNQVRSLPEAKNVLNFLFNLASTSRCQLRDKEAVLREKDSLIRELKQKVFTLSTLARQLEAENSILPSKEEMQKAPRKSKVFNNNINDIDRPEEDMDISEESEESDSEDDLTDEEWVQSGKKLPRKRSRTTSRATRPSEDNHRSENPTLEILKDSPVNEPGNNTSCCSCSKYSSCKTKKCECRDKDSMCGPSCGCAVSKCTNRQAAKPAKAEQENLEAESAEQSDNERTMSLASEGVMLLQKALKEKPSQVDQEKSGRKPLSDIGNTKTNEAAAKAGKRRNWRKVNMKLKTVVIPHFPEITNTESQQVKPKINAPLKLPRAMTASTQNNPPLAEKNSADSKETILAARPPKDSEGKENKRV